MRFLSSAPIYRDVVWEWADSWVSTCIFRGLWCPRPDIRGLLALNRGSEMEKEVEPAWG